MDLTQHDETEIAQAGIGRKFQKPTVFESQTVRANIELALSGNRGGLGLALLSGKRERRHPDRRHPANRAPEATCRLNWPRIYPTVKNNGSKSACCWRRTPSFCWLTNPWQV